MSESSIALKRFGFELPALAPETARSLSRALMHLLIPCEKLIRECMEERPPRGSEGDAMLKSVVIPRAQVHAGDGFLMMEYAVIAGFDHVRAFNQLLRSPSPGPMPLATLTRGALEALSRAWYLLSCESEGDYFLKVLSLLYSDLRYSAIHGGPVYTRGGDEVDAAKRRGDLAVECQMLDEGEIKKIEIAKNVAAMLDSEFADGTGAQRYSDLSAIAHGQRIGVNEFIAITDEGRLRRAEAPEVIAVEFTTEILLSIDAVSARAIKFFGDDLRRREILAQARERAYNEFLAVVPDDGSELILSDPRPGGVP